MQHTSRLRNFASLFHLRFTHSFQSSITFPDPGAPFREMAFLRPRAAVLFTRRDVAGSPAAIRAFNCGSGGVEG